jgi:hypothetical protein
MCERWIKLFGDTCGELFEEPVAESRGFIRRNNRLYELWPCLGYRNLHDGTD